MLERYKIPKKLTFNPWKDEEGVKSTMYYYANFIIRHYPDVLAPNGHEAHYAPHKKEYIVTVEKNYKRDNFYDSLEYPYFAYPFHFIDSADGRVDVKGQGAYARSVASFYCKGETRYPDVSGISMYQPEFNMLKRLYAPWKFNYSKIPYKITTHNDPNYYDYTHFWKYWEFVVTSSHDFAGTVLPGYPQGFMEGISAMEFDAYLVSNQTDKFILIVPKKININLFKKERWAGILFLGTYGMLKGKEECYNIIDVVVLYDTKFVDYVRL